MVPSNNPVTLCLVASCIIFFLLSVFGFEEALYRMFLISQYASPEFVEIREGQVWRLITPVLLHFGLFHIFFNMFWTWTFGQLIERQHGTLALAGITLAIGIISNFFQYRETGPLFGGMSGVIFGYFGFLWIQGLINPNCHIRLNRAIVILFLGWFAVSWSGLVKLLFDLNIANTAHAAGLLSGMVMALAATILSRSSKPRTG